MIGTGASGVQAITEIAKTMGHLTVFQRTLNWCAPLRNSRIDAETMGKIRATYAEVFAGCRETYGCFIHAADPRKALEVSDEEREAFYEKLYNERASPSGNDSIHRNDELASSWPFSLSVTKSGSSQLCVWIGDLVTFVTSFSTAETPL